MARGGRNRWARKRLGAAIVATACIGSSLWSGPAPATAADLSKVRSVPNPTQVLVVGDSVGEAVVRGIGLAGTRVVDSTFWGCRLVRGRIRYTSQVGKPCKWRALWRRSVQGYHPRVVVLISGVWDLFDVQPRRSGTWLKPGTPRWADYYATMLQQGAKILGATGAHVIIPTIPYFNGVAAGPASYPASSFDPDRVRAANRVIKRLASRPSRSFTAPDLNAFLAPTGRYQDGLGAFPRVRIDGVHFNGEGAALIGTWLAPKLNRWLDTPRRKDRRPGPVRVLLIGDALTAGYQDAAANRFARKGYVVSREGAPGRSLLDRGVCDGSQAKALLERDDPDVVVLQSVGNYGDRPGVGACAPRVKPGSTAYFRQWRDAAERNQKILTSRGAELLWVLNPALEPDPERSVVPRINTIYRQLAGDRHGLIDGWNAFGGSKPEPTLHDGPALTAAGGAVMADFIDLAVR